MCCYVPKGPKKTLTSQDGESNPDKDTRVLKLPQSGVARAFLVSLPGVQ